MKIEKSIKENQLNVSINSDNWQVGLYFLRVSDAVGEVIYTSKLNPLKENLSNLLFDFNCPKTASGSIGRLLLCINPFSLLNP